MLKGTARRTGVIGEDIACNFLKQKGYRIIEKNYRRPWGEIDVIAEKGEIVHFVEVKAVSRALDTNGSRESFSREIEYRPEEMVTAHKLRKVTRTAAIYMEQKKDEREYQIDVIGVLMDSEKRIARCRFFAQAMGE